MTKLILVNENDDVLGEMEKLEAHQKGLLHRAVSVLVFNQKGEWLLQQRADHKYHSPGLWSNTCCSHPLPGENTESAAKRRLLEEMGLNLELKKAFHFIYKIEFNNGLTEHELDHVFIAESEKNPVINPEEAKNFRWIGDDELKRELKLNPNKFTYWFLKIHEKLRP